MEKKKNFYTYSSNGDYANTYPITPISYVASSKYKCSAKNVENFSLSLFPQIYLNM